MASDIETSIQQSSDPEASTFGVDTKSTVSQSAPGDRPDVSLRTESESEKKGSIEVTAARTQTPNTKVEKNPKTKKISDSKTLLYCRETGYRHSILQEFGIGKCPACSEELSPKSRTVERDDAEGKGEEKPTAENSEIAFEVEYEDEGGKRVGQKNWPGPFDLQEARKGVVIQDQHSILRVVSVLRTSFPADEDRSPMSLKTLKDQDVLNDPSVSIRVHSTKLVVYSQRFLKVLRSFVSYYPEINLEAKSVVIEEPYCVVAHHLRELREFQQTHNYQKNAESSAATRDGNVDSLEYDEETNRHIDTILGFVRKPKWEESVKMEESRYSHTPPTCTYQMLWLLYKPGDTVYTESNGKPAASVIQSVKVDPAVLSLQPDKLMPYKLTIWYLDFDGRHVRRWSRVVTIAPFEGEKEISTLSVVPCEIFDQFDSGKRRSMLETEGERWYQLLSPKQVRYVGDTIGLPKRKIDGRAVIDCDAYWKDPPKRDSNALREFPDILLSKEQRQKVAEEAEKEPRLVNDIGDGSTRCLCESCLGLRPHPPSNFIWTEYDLIDPTTVKSLDLPDRPEKELKHRYLICSRRLMGFVLKSRQWEHLDVACCQDVDINKTAVERLVMPQENKDLIRALVHRYTADHSNDTTTPPPWGTDFIEDKGHGRIFLLHGSPGVGKTYTAECIAEYTGRPLLSLTCGDLGNDETQVEKALSKWFDFAERWGAVMLLDEADVYTEKRMIADLNRNSMVSVFLRCMEYYKGILFLTTNRVGTFDDAFVSRIHIIIHYKDLSPEYRNAIWNQFFDKLEEERNDIEIRRNCRSYVMEDTTGIRNGREIRNAFQTAVALAYYEFSQKENKKPSEVAVLTSKHFEKVCRITNQFRDYLKDVNDGLDENQRAAMIRSRARDGQVPDLP